MEDIPEGKVRTTDGKIIDRIDACFGMAEHKEDKSILFTFDGTAYRKTNERGTIKRLTFKNSERRTKAEHKRSRREHFTVNQ